MAPLEIDTPLVGTFSLPSQPSVQGYLTLNGKNTALHVWDTASFELPASSLPTVTGVLNTGRRISLLGCVATRTSCAMFAHDERSHFLELSPNFVLSGGTHLVAGQESVSEIYFTVRDDGMLFNPRKTVVLLGTSKELVSQTLDLHEERARTSIGDDPSLLLHLGPNHVFTSRTDIGVITAHHFAQRSLGGPEGATLRNHIRIRIEFREPVEFRVALSRVHQTARYLELVAGRSQTPRRISVHLNEAAEHRPQVLEVYPTTYSADSPTKGRGPHFTDLLIDAVERPEVFGRVLARWLERDESWKTPRVQFSRAWRKDNLYDEDRAVSGANMFDLLPAESFPEAPPVPRDVLDAKRRARDLFRNVSRGPERNSVLGALGRVGAWSLKQRIRHRTAVLSAQIGNLTPEIDEVTDAAVDCRNQYVHGTPAGLACGDLRVFLTNTLEFVFGASDLVDAGWDIGDWARRGHHGYHPFGTYLVGYEANLKRLKEAKASEP